ncbi:MAG: hypothetical protein NkDv07_0280 [Candidatus Improbicoccus devescovinae]|nr:MAG: hypothetical protein NkDv07_0280 [Candidatus Improbicoccus devescovinae]
MHNKKIYQKILAIIFIFCICICQGAIRITASMPAADSSGVVVYLCKKDLEETGLQLTEKIKLGDLKSKGLTSCRLLQSIPGVPIIWCYRHQRLGVKAYMFIGWLSGAKDMAAFRVTNIIRNCFAPAAPIAHGFWVYIAVFDPEREVMKLKVVENFCIPEHACVLIAAEPHDISMPDKWW